MKSIKSRIQEYKLMCSVFEYLVKKGMGFCYLENGRMIDRQTAKQYIADNHYLILNEV